MTMANGTVHCLSGWQKTSGIEVIHTPYGAPRPNALCDRFVGRLRRVCQDHVLVIGVRQLIRIQKIYVAYFNQAQPHQGKAQVIPGPIVSPPGEPKAVRVIAFPVLNGLHHDYRRAAS